MASSTKRFIIAFLWVDLIVSAGFLAYAALFHSAQNMTKESIISNDINIINPTVNSGERKNTKTIEDQNVDRQIRDAKENVKNELSRQTEAYHRSNGKEDGWITLKELESISKETYDECLRQLEFERKQSAEKLEKRRKFIAELQTGILTDEEMSEFRQALEFLNICDECKANGTPMPDRSADFDTAKERRLQSIARKYCCAVIGCSEETITMHESVSHFAGPGNSYYIPVLPKNVSTLKLQ